MPVHVHPGLGRYIWWVLVAHVDGFQSSGTPWMHPGGMPQIKPKSSLIKNEG